MEEMNIREFVKIKSDRLNYEDFIMGPQDFKIVRLGKKTDQGRVRLLMFFEGREDTPYWATLGMVKCLSNPDGWGLSEFSDWIGRRIRLFGEPTVVYAGKEHGGIQISHVSHVETEFTTKITLRRGLRVDYTIFALEDAVYPAAQFTEKLHAMRGAIQSGKMSAQQVITHAEKTGKLTQEQKDAISAPIESDNQ
jgi:hypothetical protein